jgi:hypothetical protein
MFPRIHVLGGQSSPERDDVVALSRLYPANGFSASTGCVAGRVLTSTGEPFTGANVVAWNLDDAADALSWVTGAALANDAGAYTICGLRPGARYRIDVQEIEATFAGGSRIGPFSTPAIVPGPPESWSGTSESSDPALDPPASFAPVQVAAGTTRSGVDLRLNRQAFTVSNPAWALNETPLDFAVGDFDGDGHQDFVGVQYGFSPGNLVSFSRGRGDGTFDPPVVIDHFNGNGSVVAGQLNATLDANLDVAVASNSTSEVRVYFGDGHGDFAPPQTVIAADGFDGVSSKLAVGNLDGDAFTDVACFTRHADASATVYALLGGGSGTFTVVPTEVPPPLADVVPERGELLLGQFAGSPHNDLLTMGASGYGDVTPLLQLLQGDGAGHFTAGTVPLGGVTRRFNGLAAGDLDRDGRLDLALSDLDPVGAPDSPVRTWMTLLRGDGGGGFALAHRYRIAEESQPGIVIADFNRDGRPDVASSGWWSGTPGAKAPVGLGDGAGGVREVIQVWGLAEFPVGFPGEIESGDFDGDGKPDLLLSDGASSSGFPEFVHRNSVLLSRELGGEIGPCVAGDERLCLAGGRFRVEATWTTDAGDGRGHAVSLTPDTGYFWFFAGTNIEVIVKVLDACGVNNRFWVFASGLTDVGVVLRVTDSLTGAVRTYTNPRGAPFSPRQDTNAFACP